MQIEQIGNLTTAILSQYGLTKRGWSVDYIEDSDNNALCVYREKKIKLSKLLLPYLKLSVVKDIILHEVAHALTPGEAHNELWRKKFISIGGSGKEVYKLEESVRDESVYRQLAPYIYICPSCKKETPDFKAEYELQSCNFCAPDKFDPDFLLIHEKT